MEERANVLWCAQRRGKACGKDSATGYRCVQLQRHDSEADHSIEYKKISNN